MLQRTIQSATRRPAGLVRKFSSSIYELGPEAEALLRERGANLAWRHYSHRTYAAGNASLAPPALHKGTKLLVCDMAGTTVEENGLVYTTLRDMMCRAGLAVTEDDMHPWHGAAKEEVVRHFVQREAATSGGVYDESLASAAAAARERLPLRSTGAIELELSITSGFESELRDAYLAPGSPLGLIDPALPDYFEKLRSSGVKVGLNTGYPRMLQSAIIDRLGMAEMVDGFISAQDVAAGRPWPFMTQRLMEQLGVADARTVAKAGDTERDMGEALNAGCMQAIGVLSGADSAETLKASGATTIVANITQLELAL